MKVHVPEAASTLLLQEEKFKFYFAQLSELVRTHTSGRLHAWLLYLQLILRRCSPS